MIILLGSKLDLVQGESQFVFQVYKSNKRKNKKNRLKRKKSGDGDGGYLFLI